MSDQQTMQKPADQGSISVHSESEVQKWAARFHCTREDLLYAVHKIGTSSFKVESYLKRQGRVQ
jgi:hypothetical protein